VSKSGLPQSILAEQDKLELAKWLAIIAMAVDHYGKIVAPELYLPTHLVGRISFPLFAWIIGCRLAAKPSLASHYLKWLIPFAILSQPIFVIAGRGMLEGNILFTLTLGIVASDVIIRARNRRVEYMALPILAGLSFFVEFGLPGVASVVALRLMAERNLVLAAWAVGPVGVLANLSLSSGETSLLGLAALLASCIAVASIHFHVKLPRLPKMTFYVFYPTHLLALHLWDII